MAQVSIRNISKNYTPGVPVLENFNLEIASGEKFFLLGPSGCGKSTLLRILAGLVPPSSGTIAFDGVDITALPPEKRRAAMVFQNYALWPHLDVFENVAFGLRINKTSGSELKRRVIEVLDLVRLGDCIHRKVPSLSGGQQQRVALARALAVNPALLLLDEPLSNLDARLRDTMRSEIRRICEERDLTALYVTHDRQEALSMADRIAVLNKGVICGLGTPQEVYNRPTNRFCAEFLGDINIFAATTENNQLITDFGMFPYSGEKMGKVTIAIRPERIHFCNATDAGAISVKLLKRTFLGESCEWQCSAGNTTLIMREFAPIERSAQTAYIRFETEYLLTLKD